MACLLGSAPRAPVQDDLARVAGAGRRERRLVVAEREAVGDRGRDVQARLEHHRHLVPGLVHLPAVDAPDRQQLEHDLVDVERDLLGRDAEDGDRRRRGPCCRWRPGGRPGCPTSRARRRSPRPCPSSRWTSAEVALARVDGDRRAHPGRERRGAIGVGLADTTTNRAPAWRTTAVAIRPIGPAPVTSTSSPRTGNASAVWTALPNGSKIAATSSSMPGQWCQTLVIGSDDVLGERAVAVRRPGRSCWRTGGGARPGSGGTARSRRGPRR